MIVFEVGCGKFPILVKESDKHYANDITFRDNDRIRLDQKGFEVIEGSIFDIDVEPQSADVVLTRNVFSCGYFGVTDKQYMSASWEERRSIERGCLPNKVALLRIASKMLVEGGHVVVFDWNTPHIAWRDFPNAADAVGAFGNLRVGREAVEEVLGADFVIDVLVATQDTSHYMATIQKK